MLLKGHVIPNTPISVNMWNTRDHPYAKLFFLTHFHPDHMHGLTSSWNYPIYASSISCKLLKKIIGISDSHLCCLQEGQPKKITIDLEGTETVLVTAFDANHCPGSIMILFQGYFGNIFFTGDFRYETNFFDFSLLPNIDILYLDNKYCSKECDFPPRNAVMDDILQLAHSCAQKSKRIYVGVDDVGKEDLLLKLAVETHTTIWISEKKKQEILKILDFSHIIALETSEAKFFVVPSNQINGHNIEKWNTDMTICAILPSARYCGFKFQPYNKYDNIHIAHLSNHSSFTELVSFVKNVRPHCVIPIIDKSSKGIFGIDISNRADMSVFDNFLARGPVLEFVVPEVVKKTMDLWSENAKSLPTKKRKLSRSTKLKLPKRSQLHEIESHSSSEESLSSECDTANESDEETSQNINFRKDYVWEVIHIPADGSRKLLYID